MCWGFLWRERLRQKGAGYFCGGRDDDVSECSTDRPTEVRYEGRTDTGDERTRQEKETISIHTKSFMGQQRI
jgi:hypothetical protein